MAIKDLIAQKRADPDLREAWAVSDVARMAGDLAREMRARAEMKQGDLAAALKISQPRISQIESGKVENLPPLDILARYAVACDDTLVLTTASELKDLIAERDALRAALDEKQDADTTVFGDPLRVKTWSTNLTLPSDDAPLTTPPSKTRTE